VDGGSKGAVLCEGLRGGWDRKVEGGGRGVVFLRGAEVGGGGGWGHCCG